LAKRSKNRRRSKGLEPSKMAIKFNVTKNKNWNENENENLAKSSTFYTPLQVGITNNVKVPWA